VSVKKLTDALIYWRDKAIKLPFMEKLFSIDPFANENRSRLFLYWRYEANAYDFFFSKLQTCL